MNSLNLSTILLLAGLGMLLVNVILSAVRLRRGQLRVGLLSVGVALAACAIITVGIVRLTFSEPADAGNGGAAAASDAASANGVVQPISARPSDSAKPGSVPSAAEVTAMAQGGLPDPMKTAAANGKAPAVMMTAAAQPAASTTSSTTSRPLIAPWLALLLTAASAIGVILAGLFLFLRERRHTDFDPSNSHGLLNIGAGVFAVVAALVIPMMAAPATAQASGAVFGAAAQTTPTVAAPRIVRSATSSSTPVPSLTPTEPPTLTPVSSETPIVLYTPIPYTSTYSALTTTNCTVTAVTGLNLRGDPSTDQQAIGRVFAGSLLPVTGQSVDKKWWRVVNDDMGSAVEGWVSADFVKADASCLDGSVPIVGAGIATGAATGPATSVATGVTATTPAAAKATQTSTATASATLAASRTPRPTIAETVANCTIMTISAASLRTGPGRSFTILGQIPDRTALTATEKSVDGQWLHVSYAAPDGTKDGWISSSLVMASAACQSLTAVTLTPAAS